MCPDQCKSFPIFFFFKLSLFALLGRGHSKTNGVEDKPMTVQEFLEVIEPDQASQILSDIFQDYDRVKRPFYRVKPVEIGTLLEITAITYISEENMEFQATASLTQIWEDPRVAFEEDNNDSFLILRGENLNKLWLPDTYILNARKMSIESSTYSAVVFANGTIHYSYKMTITVLAKMNFRDYPMDAQILYIDISSYTYLANQLILKWEEDTWLRNEMAGYVVTREEKLSDIDGKSFLSYSMTVHRRIGYFIMQFFFPCILCAVVSWLPFWMDRYEIGDRMALSITTLLTEVFLSQYINSTMPRVSYIKAADEYLLATFIFIFMGLLENVVVYNYRSDVRKRKKEKKKKKAKNKGNKVELELHDIHCYGQEITPTEMITDKNNLKEESSCSIADQGTNKVEAQETTENDHDLSLVVDKISRVFFPLLFIVFQAYYFGRYR